MAVTFKITVFWEVTLCSLGKGLADYSVLCARILMGSIKQSTLNKTGAGIAQSV
jgi:hypothetical protein